MSQRSTDKQLRFNWEVHQPNPSPPFSDPHATAPTDSGQLDSTLPLISEASSPQGDGKAPSVSPTRPPPPLVRPDRQCSFQGAPHWDWPPPAHDRDSITVDRIHDDIDGCSHRFTISRGDFVEVFLSSNRLDVGEVIRISHAKGEVCVRFEGGSSGVWFSKGQIYPTLEPTPKPPVDGLPLNSIIDEINEKHGAGLTESDRVPRHSENLKMEIVAFLAATPEAQFTTGDLRHEFHYPRYHSANPLDNPVHLALRELVDAGLIHVEEPTWGESRISIRRPAQDAYTFDAFKTFYQEFRAGSVSFQRYRDEFERLVESQDAIKSELLSRFKAKELAALATRMGSYDAGRSTMERNASSIVRSMISSFVLDGTVQYSPLSGDTYESAVLRKVRAVTSDDYERELERRRQVSLDEAKGLTNPEFLEEFRTFVRAKGEKALTDEQLAAYDAMVADRTRTQRKQTPQTAVAKFESESLKDIEFQLTQGFHDKRNCPLWIVKISVRVERDAFDELNRKAKMLGGWYSSFKKSDAGFQFLQKESADKFCSLLNSNANRTDELEARRERKETSAAERLHQLADGLAARADEIIERSMNSLQNTVRRSEMQAGVRGRAYADQAVSRTLHSIAEAMSRGEANYLDGIRHKNVIETLESLLYLAKWARVRTERQNDKMGHTARGRPEEEPISLETIRFVEFPYPSLYKRNLEDLVHQCRGRSGAKQAAEKMAKRLSREPGEYVTFKETFDIELLRDFLDRAAASGIETDRIKSSLDPFKRLQRANITTIHELRAALREYLGHRAAKRGDDPVQLAERELIGRDLPGFFPTPRPVIDRMLELAEIEPHHRVLEPSCGKGDILDAIHDYGSVASLTAIEQNQTLAEVLAAKGHDVIFADFLEHQGNYHRIVMNPPFENGADIDHVRHAFSLLIPGGRLVAVMSEGPFFRQNKKATDFRDWLEGVSGTTELLTDDAFQGKDAFRQTSVRTRIVVINKEAP